MNVYDPAAEQSEMERTDLAGRVPRRTERPIDDFAFTTPMSPPAPGSSASAVGVSTIRGR